MHDVSEPSTNTTDAPPGQQPEQPTETPVTPDYKDLYEKTQAKLTLAEQTAREHGEKAKRLDEIEAAQQT